MLPTLCVSGFFRGEEIRDTAYDEGLDLGMGAKGSHKPKAFHFYG